jgi:8-oxo-dGTP pyrophosphatase MutT (NUDIX family)
LLEPTYKEDWEIPGGIIEENESPREACKREVLEEL